MTIQINNDIFLPKIKQYAGKHRPRYKRKSILLAEDILNIAQGWFDERPWKNAPKEHFDTQKECRISLALYVKERLNFSDKSKEWFVPSAVWLWVAKVTLTYVVKIIIENYWDDLILEIGLL